LHDGGGGVVRVSRLSNTPGRDGTKFLGFIEVPYSLFICAFTVHIYWTCTIKVPIIIRLRLMLAVKDALWHNAYGLT
jgi:hypothetical protein